jgi:surface antigen
MFPLVAAGITAFSLVAAVFMTADFVAAADGSQPGQAAAGCSCPQSGASGKPKFAGLTAPLDEGDEVAALESLQLALSEVADGSSYVWHRSNGRLSGLVKPMSSFKDSAGSVCRHVLVVLNSAETTKKTEAVACRLSTGVWQLDG